MLAVEFANGVASPTKARGTWIATMAKTTPTEIPEIVTISDPPSEIVSGGGETLS